MRLKYFVTILLLFSVICNLVGCGKNNVNKNDSETIKNISEQNTNDDVSDEIKEIILSRDLFLNKKLIARTVNVSGWKPYEEDWKVRDIINEKYFSKDSIEWKHLNDNELLGSLIMIKGYFFPLNTDVSLVVRVSNGKCSFITISYKNSKGKKTEINALKKSDKGAPGLFDVKTEREFLNVLITYDVMITTMLAVSASGK